MTGGLLFTHMFKHILHLFAHQCVFQKSVFSTFCLFVVGRRTELKTVTYFLLLTIA